MVLCPRQNNVNLIQQASSGIKQMASLLMLLLGLRMVAPSGIRPLPGLPEVFYTQSGDIDIGVIIPVHRYDTKTFCSAKIREIGALQRVEAIVFAVNQINQREDILPNVTLGFTIMDDCSKDTTALVRALHLIQDTSGTDTNNSDSLHRIDVVGVIGSESSRNTVQISDLLSLFQMPILSYISTSPLLSNKYVHSYFSRIVPADTLQAKVIVDMVKQFGWSYISIIYAEGSYGGEGYRAVKAGIEDSGFCLAVIREMRQSFKDADYDDIVRELRGTPRGKVVVIFAPLYQTRAFLSSAKRNNASGQFTWIGSDAWGRNIQDYRGLEEDFLGALTIKFYSGTTEAFDDYFQRLTPLTASRNPWFKAVLEEHCSFNESSNKPKCSMQSCFACSGAYRPETTVPLVIDAVYTYAHALHSLISQCPAEKLTSVRDCITSKTLLREIRNVSFEGENGLVYIDQNGDGVATYEVQNLQKIDGMYALSSTGVWNSYMKKFTRFDHESIMWKPSVLVEGESWPTSTCSDNCAKGHQAVRTQPHCCWYCQKCRDNERTVIQDDLPQCQVCPTEGSFLWPDPESRTRCEPIAITYIGVHDVTGRIIVAVDVFTIIVAIFVTSMFVKNNKEKLIKASSRELSYLILIGIFISSVFVGTLAYRPNDVTCNVTYIGFHLSFTLTYAPLTVKTNRVYRIFRAGKKSKVRPMFINSRSQIFFTILILVTQTLIIGIWVVIDTPRSLTLMPNFNEKYVEITCKLPEIGFMVSVACNMTLVLVCTFYAIKTRKLPDNFNESRFVSFCVYTTIVLWLAFIPTYFTTTKTTLRSLFLAVAMVANSNVTLFFLYVPKLYALYYVSSDAHNLVAVGTTLGHMVVRSGANKVMPSRA